MLLLLRLADSQLHLEIASGVVQNQSAKNIIINGDMSQSSKIELL
jgi:metallophosphoesterase superfamily enzyme